jgi:hypothetical protein
VLNTHKAENQEHEPDIRRTTVRRGQRCEHNQDRCNDMDSVSLMISMKRIENMTLQAGVGNLKVSDMID